MELVSPASFYLVLFLLTIFLLLLFVPVVVCIVIENFRENNHISIKVTFKLINLRIFSCKKDLLFAKNTFDLPALLWKLFLRFKIPVKRKTFPQFSLNFISLVPQIIIKTTVWYKMNFFLQLDTGNPVYTALLSAKLQSILEVLSSHLYGKLKFSHSKPRFWIYPYFLQQRFHFFVELEAKCKIIIALIFALFIAAVIFTAKLLERWGNNERTSYSRFDGNSYGKPEGNGGR